MTFLRPLAGLIRPSNGVSSLQNASVQGSSMHRQLFKWCGWEDKGVSQLGCSIAFIPIYTHSSTFVHANVFMQTHRWAILHTWKEENKRIYIRTSKWTSAPPQSSSWGKGFSWHHGGTGPDKNPSWFTTTRRILCSSSTVYWGIQKCRTNQAECTASSKLDAILSQQDNLFPQL